MSELNELLNSFSRIVFLTGAGVSTASGIPDYRSKNGLYSDGQTPEYLLSATCLRKEPERHYQFVKEKMFYPQAKPNVIHEKMALFAKEKDRISLISADASRLPPAPRQYNLVFLDAPYNKGLSVAALQSLVGQDWLAEDALVLVELEKNEPLEMESIPFFEQVDERRYGLARVVFLHFLPAKK